MTTRSAYLCLLATLWLSGGTLRADSGTASTPASASAPPCPSVYECYLKGTVVVFTIRQAADVDRQLIMLERDLVVAQARYRRLGCVVGGGLGVSVVATDEFEVRAAPAGHVGVTCGWRF